ncbi:MAG: DUF2510 domain-containing protein [Micropruina sp.]
MSNAGWYPDPGGQPGMYRYWTGSSWSTAVTPNPQQGLPTAPGTPGQRSKTPVGWWLGGLAALVAIALVIWFVFQQVSGLLGGNTGPVSNPTAGVCPRSTGETPTARARAADGRVHGGKLSFPELGAPWTAPEPEWRVPFGTDALTQTVSIEPNYDGNSSWVASVLVGELVAGDGFFSPQQGSEIVVKCIMGVFYGDAEVVRDDKVNKATTLDGKDAWLVESHLTFDIPNLKTKGELAIILIVATSLESSSIFYASIPDTSPQLVQPARDAMKALKVSE